MHSLLLAHYYLLCGVQPGGERGESYLVNENDRDQSIETRRDDDERIEEVCARGL